MEITNFEILVCLRDRKNYWDNDNRTRQDMASGAYARWRATWHGHLAYYTRVRYTGVTLARNETRIHTFAASTSIYCIAPPVAIFSSFVYRIAEKREISIRPPCRDKMNFVAWREVNAREAKVRGEGRGKGWTISIGFFRETCWVEWRGRET